MPLTLLPELTFVGGAFVPDQAVVVGDDGRVASVGLANAGLAAPEGTVLRLPGRALLPGLVNGHSHAFQRLLRGRTEWRAADTDNFWTWRDRMYALADRLSPESLQAVCAMTYLEMLKAGITAVGEFHYLHRDPEGRPYANPNELGLRVIAAAEEVGLRLLLLRCAYSRGGPDRALAGAQRRFALLSPEIFVAETEALEQAVRGRELVAVGIAPHSVRALHRVPLTELASAARQRGWVTHMHLSELALEVDGCLAETGLRPVELAAECGLLQTRFCAIHAIHLRPSEVTLLGRAKVSVCGCPTTERDLADGVVPADALQAAGVTLAVGSDSNAQIDLLEEARSLELNLRLVHHRRVLIGASPGHLGTEGDEDGLARRLFAAATTGGAQALGLPRSTLAPGAPADLITLDLDDPSLAGAPPEHLLGSLVFGGQVRALRDVMVGGRFVLREGQHPREREIRRACRAALAELGAGAT